MEEKLKQRLVGAAVILALAVIFLPMLLDGNPSEEIRQIDLNIPDRPASLDRGQIIPLELPEHQPSKTAASDDPSEIELLPPQHSGDKSLSDSVMEPDLQDASSFGSTAEELKQAVPPDPVKGGDQSKNSMNEPKLIEEAPLAEDSKTPSRPLEKTLGSEPKQDEPNQNEQRVWLIQLGVFSKQTNASNLNQQASKWVKGCKVESIKASERSLSRVRCGRYSSRAEAEAERDRLQSKLGLSGLKVLSLSAEDVMSHQKLPAAIQGWAIQTGSFKTEQNAKRMMSEIRKGGYPAYVDTLQEPGKIRYRVRIGPYSNQAETKQKMAALQKKLKIQAILVKTP